MTLEVDGHSKKQVLTEINWIEYSHRERSESSCYQEGDDVDIFVAEPPDSEEMKQVDFIRNKVMNGRCQTLPPYEEELTKRYR